MDKFQTLVSSVIPIAIENVDTDQIIPARFLKATTREGFGENLFRDWRYDRNSGEPLKDFVLNDSTYEGKILICGNNFGCGSSREHAAWALYDYGFRAVVSSMFADIFKNNALNNGLLAVEVSPSVLASIFKAIQEKPESKMVIDLEEQTLALSAIELKEPFDINPFKKSCLINGYDNLDYLLSLKDKIEAYELERS